MANDAFEGWGYNIKIAEIPGMADHTWVNCPGHGKFHCWGGVSGKNNRKFVSGKGNNYKVANCYRRPWKNHKDTAGIVYALNGLCHQTANLFMYPARTVLNLKVKGYWFSVATYGVHGSLTPGGLTLPFFLGWLAAVYNPCYQKHKLAAEEPPIPDPLLVKLDAMYARLQAEGPSDPNTVLARELETMVEHQDTGVAYDAIADLHQELLGAKSEAIASGQRGAALAEAVNSAVYRFQEGLGGRLDAAAYTALTGTAPGDRIAIVDPGIAEETAEMMPDW